MTPQTAKTKLISDDGERKNAVWIPKTQDELEWMQKKQAELEPKNGHFELTPELLYKFHKRHVMNSDTPVILRGSELTYRLLIAERLDRSTVMELTRQTRREVGQSVSRWVRHTKVCANGDMSITGLRRAFMRYRRNTIFEALKESV